MERDWYILDVGEFDEWLTSLKEKRPSACNIIAE